jgi:hypothetical protein
MRRSAKHWASRRLAIYHRFANKHGLIDSMIDLVFEEIRLPSRGLDWRTATRQRAITVRDALLRQPWGIGVMEFRRRRGPANLRHHDAVIGSLRPAASTRNGRPRLLLLDSYMYGFALTKMNLPFQTSDDVAEAAQSMLEPFPFDGYANMVKILTNHIMKTRIRLRR